MSEIPAKVIQKIRAFMLDRSTGSVTLHFNDGHINSYKIEEHAKVQRKPDTASAEPLDSGEPSRLNS